MNPQAALLPDSRRLHLQHGPIDLVIEAWGTPGEIASAYRQAVVAFQTILSGLAAELPLLRQRLPATGAKPVVQDRIARRMIDASWPHRAVFITPMAAVAGAVADHVLQALLAGRDLAKAYVNNGGDIAVWMRPGQRLDCGLVTDMRHPQLAGIMHLTPEMRVGGIATSGAPGKGQGGRSFSLGIADAVTILARDAATADAAATIVANAVDLPDHPLIGRAPAESMDPDSDLGRRLVTISVPRLSPGDVALALEHGRHVAEDLCRSGMILAAILALQDEVSPCGDLLRGRLAA